ncbi:hypothetical protein M885DRAFT_613792 [Pelagophyceae sp. CCMP2097]|nr:hypothetical protein M885DRAFT_613792 [Pelagophyceae sp. CCMP2097]
MGKGGARKATPLDKEKALREEAEASLAASELKAAQFEAEATTAKAAVQAAKAQAMDFAARVAKLEREATAKAAELAAASGEVAALMEALEAQAADFAGKAPSSSTQMASDKEALLEATVSALESQVLALQAKAAHAPDATDLKKQLESARVSATAAQKDAADARSELKKTLADLSKAASSASGLQNRLAKADSSAAAAQAKADAAVSAAQTELNAAVQKASAASKDRANEASTSTNALKSSEARADAFSVRLREEHLARSSESNKRVAAETALEKARLQLAQARKLDQAKAKSIQSVEMKFLEQSASIKASLANSTRRSLSSLDSAVQGASEAKAFAERGALQLERLGATLAAAGELADAEALFGQSAALRGDIFGARHAQHAGTLRQLASHCQSLNDLGSALEYMERSCVAYTDSLHAGERMGDAPPRSRSAPKMRPDAGRPRPLNGDLRRPADHPRFAASLPPLQAAAAY